MVNQDTGPPVCGTLDRTAYRAQGKRMDDAKKTRIRVSQETVAIVTVGLALAALMVTSTGLVTASIGRVSDRLDHNVAELRAEARADRAEARVQREAIRAEARVQREAIRAEARADREAFARQIAKLAAGQAHLVGLIESLRDDRLAADAGSG